MRAAARHARRSSRERRARDAVVADILTLAPGARRRARGRAASRRSSRTSTRAAPPGFPPYSIGARLPRTGARAAAVARRPTASSRGLERGRRELNETRARGSACRRSPTCTAGSRARCASSRRSRSSSIRAPGRRATHVVGPLLWEPPAGDVGPARRATTPLVLVAPSTSQDPRQRLLRAALEGLADLPVRVLATHEPRGRPASRRASRANARLVEWLSYARTMPHCAVVVCHGGHGTVARALASGCVVVAVPGRGRHERERRARGLGGRRRAAAAADGAGRGRCGLAVRRALADPRRAARARAFADWHAAHDGAARAAALVEAFARG